jgi:hypothetical protein
MTSWTIIWLVRDRQITVTVAALPRQFFKLDILVQKGLIWTFGHYPLPQLERIFNPLGPATAAAGRLGNPTTAYTGMPLTCMSRL